MTKISRKTTLKLSHLASLLITQCLVLLLICLGSVAYAQTTDTILSGRPGVFIPPYVVGTGVLQHQAGVDHLTSSLGEGNQTSQANTLIRLGFTESFEFNLFVNGQATSYEAANQEDQNGFSVLTPGVRFNILNEDTGFVNGLGLQVDYSLPNVDSEFAADQPAPALTLISYHQLTESVSWSNNLGVSQDGNSNTPTHFWRTAVAFPWGFGLDGYIEVYGFESEGRSTHYTDAGFGYIVNKDLQLDLSYGYGKNFGITETFVSAGVSIRQQLWN